MTVSVVCKFGGKRIVQVTPQEAKEKLAAWETKIAELGEDDDVEVNLIDLSCRKWSVEAIQVLKPFFQKVAPQVSVLNLEDTIASLETSIGLAVMEQWAESFQSATNVREIELSENALGTRAMALLAPLFKLPKLQNLYFNNCGLSAEAVKPLVDVLVEGGGAARLREIELDKNMIGIEGSKHVGELLKSCSSLRTLSYCGCRPGPEGTKYVIEGLKTSGATGLRVLGLADCSFGSGEDDEDSIHTLAEILSKLSHLAKLLLNDTASYGEHGTRIIVDALAKANSHLSYLDMGCCALESEGAEILRELLDRNVTSLQVLKLDTNELEAAGLRKVLAPFVAKKNVLTDLSLDENLLDGSAIDALCHISLPHLRHLSLRENEELEELTDEKDRLRKAFRSTKILFEEEEEAKDAEVDDLTGAMASLQT